MKLKHLIRYYRFETTGFLIGALAGFLYWYFVGCASGTCPITSSPIVSTLYGAWMGALSGAMLKKKPKSKQETN